MKIGSENPPKLPTVLYGTPVTWHSEKPSIATVDAIPGDSQHVVITGHANGWTAITTEWLGYTVVRWVGVSTETNYVHTDPGDPFYEPYHVPSPAVVQMLWQMGYGTYASDAKNKYFVGARTVYLPECFWGGAGIPYPTMGFLYDGTSIQDIFTYMDVIPWDGEYYSYCNNNVTPYAVNEKGQAVGYIDFRDFYNWTVGRTGFMYSNGILFFIDDPSSWLTHLTDINNLGKAVGFGENGVGGYYPRGFIYDTVLKTFTYLGYGIRPYFINNAGHVVGDTYLGNSALIWIYRDGVFETVAGPSPYVVGPYWLHESGKVWITYHDVPVLLTRCAP